MLHRNSKIACLIASSLALSATLALAADPVPVTTCGQVLEGDGILVADLDCSGETTDEPAVVLARGGTLDLAGFTITSRAYPDGSPTSVVRCDRSCRIVGPGVILGSSTAYGACVEAKDFRPGRSVAVENATIAGAWIGVLARNVTVEGSTISNNRSVGIWAGFARVEDSSITGNGLGADGSVMRGGVFGQIKSRVENSTVTGNGMSGVYGWKLRVIDSTVSGNDAYTDCASHLCIDIGAKDTLKTRNVVCESSLRREGEDGMEHFFVNQSLSEGPFPNWGVCLLD